MTTIYEFAKNHSNQLCDKYGCTIDYSIPLEEAIMAGAEFAQRWISVNEELPDRQGCYLVKCKTSYPKNCDVIVAEFYDDNKMFYSESGDFAIHDATYWRPIDF